MATLLHGTTRQRADQIAIHGPDPNYLEPGSALRAESFSTYLESGPFVLGTPELYARRKAAAFPGEGGPAILAVEVPDDIIALAASPMFPLIQGIVQFDEGAGLEELQAAWPTLTKQVLSVGAP